MFEGAVASRDLTETQSLRFSLIPCLGIPFAPKVTSKIHWNDTTSVPSIPTDTSNNTTITAVPSHSVPSNATSTCNLTSLPPQVSIDAGVKVGLEMSGSVLAFEMAVLTLSGYFSRHGNSFSSKFTCKQSLTASSQTHIQVINQ